MITSLFAVHASAEKSVTVKGISFFETGREILDQLEQVEDREEISRQERERLETRFLALKDQTLKALFEKNTPAVKAKVDEMLEITNLLQEKREFNKNFDPLKELLEKMLEK